MHKQKMSLGFKAQIKPLEKLNEEFTRVKIFVCSYGKNRNMSYISKNELAKALPSLSYCPVVAHLFQKEDGTYMVGGHDAEIVIDETGINLKDLTVPFGVVIADTFDCEEVEEYGQKLNYLTAEAFIWTERYPELMEAIYSDDCWFNQSMEIGYKNSRPYEWDSNYSEILDINFSALCLLQKADNGEDDVEPCFISSRVEPIKFTLTNEFSQVFSEMKDRLAYCFENMKFQKGGINQLTQERANEILASYSITLEDLDFDIDENMTEEDFKDKLNDFAKKKKKCSKAEKYAATYRQKYAALENACDTVFVRDDDNNVISSTYYWVKDFTDTHVFVERNLWSDENHETSVGRFSYTFDAGTVTATLTSDFEEMVATWLTPQENKQIEDARNEVETLKSDFNAYKQNYSVPNTEVEELRAFQKKTLDAQRETKELELFTRFDEKLNNEKEYEALKANCKDLSLDEISDKCFSLLGKKLANFSLNKPKNASVKVPVSNPDSSGEDDTKPYGDVYDKYLK